MCSTVDVLMPVYNAAPFLEVAIDSILAQTFRDFRLIIVDDGSSDDSAGIIAAKAAADSRIVSIRQENAGVSAALNRALEESSADYVAVMHGDDVSYPHRLEKEVAWLDANPDCVAVGGLYRAVDPEGEPIDFSRDALDHEGIAATIMSGVGGISHSTAMWRRNAVEDIGGYRSEYDSVEDLDICLRLLDIGRLANIPEYVSDYRQHAMSLGHRRADRSRELIRRCVTEAYLRQERPIPSDLGMKFRSALSPLQFHQEWAFASLLANHRGTARKHAWKSIRLKSSFKAWMLLLLSFTGPMLFILGCVVSRRENLRYRRFRYAKTL